MTEITKSITYLKEYKQLKQTLDEGKSPLLAVGLSAIHKAHLAAALGLDTGRPVLVLTDDDNAANRFAADLRGFAERDVVLLPSRELVMADVVGVSRGYEQRRLAALDELTEAHFAVASVQAAAQRTMPPELLVQSVVALAVGETAPLDELAQSLTRAGYERCVQVEGTGQFSIRGGILDVFPPQAEHPYRVEFWDDEIDSISTFDVGSQRRLEQCECLRCLPCMESIPALAKGGAAGLAKAVLALTSTRRKKQHADLQTNLERDAERLRETGSLPAADKYMPLIYPEMATAFDYLPENAIVIIEDTPRLRDAVRDFHARVADDVTARSSAAKCRRPSVSMRSILSAYAALKRQILRSGQLSQQRSRTDTAASGKLYCQPDERLRRQPRHGVCRYPQLYRAGTRGGGRVRQCAALPEHAGRADRHRSQRKNQRSAAKGRLCQHHGRHAVRRF